MPRALTCLGPWVIVAGVGAFLPALSRADELPASPPCAELQAPGDEPLHALIDRHIEARLNTADITPAAASSDEEFVRRVYLDLVGRIPTRAELRSFTSPSEPDKRASLVDRLLASDEFHRHLADQLNALLAGRTAFPMSAAWNAFLRDGVSARRGWREMARAMILARPASDRPDDPATGAVEFLARRYAGPEPLDVVTRDVTRLFFGVDMQCARCHAHPVVPEWEPVSYWGMASFFNRTYAVQVGGRTLLGERARGEVSYSTADKQTHVAAARFMTGAIPPPQAAPPSEDPRALERRQASHPMAQPGDPLLDNPDDYLVPPAAEPNAAPLPAYSLRQSLVDLALDDRNPYFARAIVNRAWAWLMGSGMVEPLDQMHLNNPGTNPALLDALAADFARHGYDFQRLYRGIALSRAYGRGSYWPEGTRRPAANYHAVAEVRPLATHDYVNAVLCAVGLFDAAGGDRATFDTAQAARFAEYVKLLDPGSDEFQPSLQQSLFLANSPRFEALIAEGGLAANLASMSDDDEFIRAAFESVLSRQPDADEHVQIKAYLAARPDRRGDAARQIVWGLINSSEFRFNH
jgi:hypothetical protein